VPTAGTGHYRRATAWLAGLRAADGAPQGRPDRTGPGRPRTRPDRLLGDKAYSNRKIRAHLHRRGITATIPEKTDQQKARAAKGSAGGRPPSFDAESYKQRNTVERAINKLKDFRAVAMRTDKREFVFRGTIDVASIKIWLRTPANQDPPDTP
jgi:transposase